MRPPEQTLACQVLVIGGGSTGAGVARDAAMRGLATILLERGSLACGTTGHFHGQLHSGARYVVSDPVAAQECARESAVLRRIAPGCITDTGGVAVILAGDNPGYAAGFLAGCSAAGVAVSELGLDDLARHEPALSRRVVRAFGVADAVLDSRRLVAACARSAADHGARILTGHEVVRMLRGADGAVIGAEVVHRPSGDRRSIAAEVVVNATGAWAPRLAALAGCSVAVRLSKGVMVAVDRPLVSRVVSRCRPAGDGDILVPLGGGAVIGTTDTTAASPDANEADSGSVSRMLSAGDELVPGFSTGGHLRAWAAIRPLAGTAATGNRQVGRSHRVLDHGAADGVGGFLSIVGGKATTFRRMAEDTVDAACAILGTRRACRTHLEGLPAPPVEAPPADP